MARQSAAVVTTAPRRARRAMASIRERGRWGGSWGGISWVVCGSECLVRRRLAPWCHECCPGWRPRAARPSSGRRATLRYSYRWQVTDGLRGLTGCVFSKVRRQGVTAGRRIRPRIGRRRGNRTRKREGSNTLYQASMAAARERGARQRVERNAASGFIRARDSSARRRQCTACSRDPMGNTGPGVTR